MINKGKNIFNFVLLFLILFLIIGVVSAYSSSWMGYKYNDIAGTGSFMQNSLRFDKSMCEQGSDFILQIAPFGCEPAVVRSDLLEENDVPVFCQIAGTKINPLIDVEAIKTMTISGKHTGGVKGFAYHPSQAALGLFPDGTIENPVLENLGYVVVILKRNPNESAMPDYVEGNLTARIRYDIDKTFGVGRAEYYLPVMSEAEWKDSFLGYGFWNGRGFLRADYVEGDKARVSIYSGSQVNTGSFSGIKDYSQLGFTSHVLKVGEKSNEIFLPGFDPCRASLSLRLNSLEDPDTRARITVNSEIVEIGQNQDFLENKCEVLKIAKRGLYQSVEISCLEDDGKRDIFTLSISPRVELEISDSNDVSKKETHEYEIGDYLFEDKSDLSNIKHIYLGYVGSVSQSKDIQDMFVVLISSPDLKTKLDSAQLDSVTNYVKYRKAEANTGDDFLDKAIQGLGAATSQVVEAGYYLFEGEDFKVIPFQKNGFEHDELYRGKIIKIKGFAKNSAYNPEYTLSGEKEYEKAMQDFNLVADSYGDAKSSENDLETYGEKALFQAIKTSVRAGKNLDTSDLCVKFKQLYPFSLKNYELKNYCDNSYLASSSGFHTKEVLVNGNLRQLSFDKIIEPSYQEYGIEVLVTGPSGSQTYRLPKSSRISLNEVRGDAVSLASEEYFTLEDLEKDYAEIRVRFAESVTEVSFDEQNVRLYFNQPQRVGAFEFLIKEINLQKVARVSVEPSFNNQFSNSTFPFKIGIEKRAIQLTPEKINKKINRLDKSIEGLQGKVDFLGQTVEWGNKACLGTGAALTLKNLIKNFNGDSIARNMIMTGDGGYNEICEKAVIREEYESIDQCFLAKSNEIDRKVKQYSEVINEQNNYISKLKDDSKETSGTGNIFEQGIINNEEVVSAYLKNELTYEQLQSTLNEIGYVEDGFFYLSKNQDGTFDKENGGINLNEIKATLEKGEGYFSEGTLSLDDLRDIELYRTILQQNADDPNIEVDEMAKKELYDVLFDVNLNTKQSKKRNTLADNLGIDPSLLGYMETKDPEKIKKYNYLGLKAGGLGLELKDVDGKTSLDTNSPLYAFRTNEDKEYILVLNDAGDGKNLPIKTYDSDNDPSTDNSIYLYSSSGELIKKDDSRYEDFLDDFSDGVTFVVYDEASYHNRYLNPEVRYFEDAPYKGYPAVVPVERETGWYAATKPVLPVGANIASYDTSGRVSSFWLCNVGENGLENYISGDDNCQMINLNTGMSFDMFYALGIDRTKELINKAVRNIELAQRAYKNGVRAVRIEGEKYTVGSPAAATPTVQCQEFMSPKDCNILFNVCDPFICPSSRCDLGGTYPVRDVIQSGVIGSIALCYPNAKWHGGDVYVPVCVSGVHAGLDGWLQVQKAYRDCLQENLETGETVGICDEMHSIYMCDFFWRQARPLAQLILPKLISKILGQSSRGGGEYLSVQDAWETAGNSIDYFKQYYANHVFTAFKNRNVDEIGAEVCKSFPSILFPDGASIVDSLTQAYSPVQFHGKFSEIPMTTATNPPLSHYKVTYIIYAGQDRGAYYRVYLRGDSTSSYFQDTSFNRYVASGYIPAGDSISESIDEQWPSGYRQLCISVNGQEECGFKQVSTSFAVDYMNDLYLQQQASQTDIKTESECVSGSTSLYSLLNPNLQEGVETAINPEIYNKGIIRVCATNNPGVGTDIHAEGEDARWVAVGYCGDKNIKCWQDQNSVKDVIESYSIEEKTLDTTSQQALEQLFADGNYLGAEELKQELEKILGLNNPKDKIDPLTELLDKTFYNKDKANIYLERGKAYASQIVYCPSFCLDGEHLVKGLFNYTTRKCFPGKDVIDDCDGNGCFETSAGGGALCNAEECTFCVPDVENEVGAFGAIYEGTINSTGHCVVPLFSKEYLFENCLSGTIPGCAPAGKSGKCLSNTNAGFVNIDESPIIRFKYNTLLSFFPNNLCIKYFNGAWRYKHTCGLSNPKKWPVVNSNPGVDKKADEIIQAMSLYSTDYIQGLDALITAVDIMGSRDIQVGNKFFKLTAPRLSLQNGVRAYHDKGNANFKFQLLGYGNWNSWKFKPAKDGIYFQYNKNTNSWEWAFTGSFYRPVSDKTYDDIVKDTYAINKGASLGKNDIELLNSLTRLDRAQGASVLFNVVKADNINYVEDCKGFFGGTCTQESRCDKDKILKNVLTDCEENGRVCCLSDITSCVDDVGRECVAVEDCPSERIQTSNNDCEALGKVCCIDEEQQQIISEGECSDCKEDYFERCTKEECLDLGRHLNKNCVFKRDILSGGFLFGGICVEEEEQKETSVVVCPTPPGSNIPGTQKSCKKQDSTSTSTGNNNLQPGQSTCTPSSTDSTKSLCAPSNTPEQQEIVEACTPDSCNIPEVTEEEVEVECEDATNLQNGDSVICTVIDVTKHIICPFVPDLQPGVDSLPCRITSGNEEIENEDYLCELSAFEDTGECQNAKGEVLEVEAEEDLVGDETKGEQVTVKVNEVKNSDSRYIGDSCGNNGRCISISSGTICEGIIKDGLCLGTNDIKCCEPIEEPSGDSKIVCPYTYPSQMTSSQLAWSITDCNVKDSYSNDNFNILCDVPSVGSYAKVSCEYLGSSTEMWCNLLGRENNKKATCYFPGDYELTDYPGKPKVSNTDTNSNIRIRLLEELERLEGTIVSGEDFKTYGTNQQPNQHCSNAVYGALGTANCGLSSVYYSDEIGASYTFNYKGTQYTKEVGTLSDGVCVGASSGGTLGSEVSYDDFLDTLVPGDIIDVFYSDRLCHGIIFVGWEDKLNYEARIFDWNGQTIDQFQMDSESVMCDESDVKVYRDRHYCKIYRYADFYVGLNPGSRENTNPIYKSWYPVNSDIYRI